MTDIQPMLGLYKARKYIHDYLRTDLPTRLVQYRNVWNMDDDLLPMPNVLMGAPAALEGKATVYPNGTQTVRITREDYDGSYNPIYRVTYAIRTYVWVNQTGSDTAELSRDCLTAVVRSALLDHPCLILGDTAGALDIGIDEASMREEYSDITAVKADRYVCGCYIQFQMSMNEVVDRLPLGTATSFQVTADEL